MEKNSAHFGKKRVTFAKNLLSYKQEAEQAWLEGKIRGGTSEKQRCSAKRKPIGV